MPTQAGGVWFIAPEDMNYEAPGASIEGSYNDGATLPTTNTWSLSRVE